MKESEVEKCTRGYLEGQGWKITNNQKGEGHHGCDITAKHKIRRKYFYIEVKGGSNKFENQAKHNGFYYFLGQILSRMNTEGNNKNKSRYYGVAVPSTWEKTLKNKVSKMKYGWSLLKLKIFLVDEKKKVIQKSYKYFLK